MISISRNTAVAMLRIARALSPPERRGWVDAMRAEIDHVPAQEIGTFALGCVWAALRSRLVSPVFVEQLAVGLMVSGAIAWAMLNIRFASRMAADGLPMAELMGYGGAAFFLAGAVITARFGAIAVALLAPPLAMVMIFITIMILINEMGAPHTSFYLALIIEHLTMLGIGIFIAAKMRRRGLAGRAELR